MKEFQAPISLGDKCSPLTIAKANSDAMTEETGVQPSLTEDEMKEYLDMVAKEVKHTQPDTTQKK